MEAHEGRSMMHPAQGNLLTAKASKTGVVQVAAVASLKE